MFARGLYAGLPWQCGDSYNAKAAKTLKLPYWHDWITGGPVKMLWQCTPEAVSATVYSGRSFWLLGNEPESPTQSNTSVNEFIAGVNKWKSSGRTGWAVPGILWTGGGFAGARWFRDYLLAGGPIYRYVHLHIYAWSGQHWRELWGELKAWLVAKGIGKAPVIVSEAAAWPHTPAPENHIAREERQSDVLGAIVDVLRSDSQLHSVFWFSGCCAGHDPYWQPTDLLTLQGARTKLGESFMAMRREMGVL